jgi:pyrroloquinoline quinone (PQQ) biosynthesis protein C
VDLENYLKPFRKKIFGCKLIQESEDGTLSTERARTWFVQFYPFIEMFPQFMSFNISKTEDIASRNFFIDNIRVERNHAHQWALMCRGANISMKKLLDVEVFPEVDALSHWMWSINMRGSLAESVASTNYTIEGIAHDLALLGLRSFPKFINRREANFCEKTYAWVKSHSHYDDEHPKQALEIIKKYAVSEKDHKKVRYAARRSLEFFHMALNACYEKGENFANEVE